MDALLVYQITYWLNGIALAVFLGIEIFWFVRQGKKYKDILSLAGGFLIYNLPFLLLALSMYLQPVPPDWTGSLRLVFLLLCIPANLWLHYHGDKGGNSVGMAIVFFLIISIPLVVIMEVFIWLY